MDKGLELAEVLAAGMKRASVQVDDLAESTNIPRYTILSLLREPVSAVLPERVYLRGQLLVLARRVGLDEARALALFDDAYPEPATRDIEVERRFPAGVMALAAGLGCVAILAVVLAFVS